MGTQIRTTTNIELRTARNQPSSLYSQVYSFQEEGMTSLSRVVNPGETDQLIVAPDVDIQSALKFIHVSAEGDVADLEASRMALSVRTYNTAKSATPSNEIVSNFTDDTVVFGALVGGVVSGEKSLASPLTLKAGAIGAVLSKDSAGVDTDFSDKNALPLTLHIGNNGAKAITVKVKALHDPSPASHAGTL
jgi:hypothetical protein